MRCVAVGVCIRNRTLPSSETTDISIGGLATAEARIDSEEQDFMKTNPWPVIDVPKHGPLRYGAFPPSPGGTGRKLARGGSYPISDRVGSMLKETAFEPYLYAGQR